MKKLFSVFLIVLFLFSGCSAKVEKLPVPDLNFNADVKITYKQYIISGTVSNTVNGICEINIKQPTLLSGLKMIICNGECSLKLGSLTYEIDKESLQQTGFMSYFAAALTNALSTSEFNKNNDGSFTLTGNTDVGKYELILDGESGYPKSLKIKDIDFSAEFSCVKANSH